MKMYVKIWIKKGTERKMTALVLDLGYRQVYLSFDASLCAELLKVSRAEFEELTIGEYGI